MQVIFLCRKDRVLFVWVGKNLIKLWETVKISNLLGGGFIEKILSFCWLFWVNNLRGGLIRCAAKFTFIAGG